MNSRKKGIRFFIAVVLITDYIAIFDIILRNHTSGIFVGLELLSHKMLGGYDLNNIRLIQIIIFILPMLILGIGIAMITYDYNYVDKMTVVIRYQDRADLIRKKLRECMLFSMGFVVLHVLILCLAGEPSYLITLISTYGAELAMLIVSMVIYTYEITCVTGIINIIWGEAVAIVTSIFIYLLDAGFVFSNIGDKKIGSVVNVMIMLLLGEKYEWYTLIIHCLLTFFLSGLLIYVVKKRDIGIYGRRKE